MTMKILHNWLIVLAVVLTLCYSCITSTMSNANPVSLHIHNESFPVSNIGNLNLSIQLKDCGNESIIKDVDRIIHNGDRIYVLDEANDVITCIDKNGRLLASTKKYIGHGRKEYIHLSDMALDESTGQIYVLCDTPSEIIIFNQDLMIDSIKKIDFSPIEMCVDTTHIMFVCRNLDDCCYEILTIKKNDLGKKPNLIIQSKIEINRIMGMGKNMTYTEGECWVSLPFNNCIYKIKNGEIADSYSIEFGDNWYKNDRYNMSQFLDVNRDRVWSILNIQKCGRYLWFNSNTEGLYCLDTLYGQCQCYNSLFHDSIPYATQLIIPQQGLKNIISFSVLPSFVLTYLRNVEKSHSENTEDKKYSLAKENQRERNAMLLFWEITGKN